METPDILTKLYDYEQNLSVIALRLGAMDNQCPAEVVQAAMSAVAAMTYLRQMVVGSVEAGALTLPVNHSEPVEC